MAEYYPLLARAVAAQPNASQDTRNGIYERARKALLAQLRAHEPPLPEQDIEREAHALEAAIMRVELEQRVGAAVSEAESPLPAKAEFEPAATKPSSRDAAPAPKPMSIAERARAHRASLAAAGANDAQIATSNAVRPAAADAAGSDSAPAYAPGAAAPPPKREAAELRAGKSDAPAAMAPGVVAARPSDARDDRAPVVFAEPEPFAERRAIPRSGLLWKFGRSRLSGADKGPAAVPVPRAVNAPLAWLAADAEAETEPHEMDGTGFNPEPTAHPGEDQIRSEPARPLAPLAHPERRNSVLYWALGSAVVVIVAGVAVLAFLLRDAPQTIDNEKPASVVAEKAPGKIVDRIGVGPEPLSTAPAGSGDLLDSGAASGAKPASPGAAPAASAPASPAAAAAPGNVGATAQNAASAMTVPVAQRAALLVQSPSASDAQAIATYVGTVVWRLDTVSQGAGQPVTLAVRAEIDVPDARFKASMLLEKNTDPSLPASHTIELRFMPAPGSVIGDVKQIDTPQMRKEESPAGDPLSGIPTPITNNYFLVGLTKGDPAQAHNIDLMRTAGWFDVPMLLANGKIAKITFEKGVAGQKALNDALASWSN